MASRTKRGCVAALVHAAQAATSRITLRTSDGRKVRDALVGFVRRQVLAPLRRILKSAGEGRLPWPLFDSEFYLRENPDVAASGVNPFLHFVLYGMREGRQSTPRVRRFAPRSYLPPPLRKDPLGPEDVVIEEKPYFTAPAGPIGHTWLRPIAFVAPRAGQSCVELAKLARDSGLFGICFRYPCAAGQAPFADAASQALEQPAWDLPFCLCWTAGPEAVAGALVEHASQWFARDSYLKIDGKPLLLVAGLDDQSRMRRIQKELRDAAAGLKWPGIYLVLVSDTREPLECGFDAVLQVGTDAGESSKTSMLSETPFWGGPDPGPGPGPRRDASAEGGLKTFRTVLAPRSEAAAGGGSSLRAYADRLYDAGRTTLTDPTLARHEKLIFLDVAGTRGDGGLLEPDARYGFGYLHATRTVLDALSDGLPRVTVIVPNYNHARYLHQRLRSLSEQTRLPDEIVFLDDASTDDSLAVARTLLAAANVPYVIVANEKNSGSVFRQWLAGLDRARHGLVWIAESDDAADPGFLEHVVREFAHEDVLLAYGEVSYIRADGSYDGGLGHYYDGLRGPGWATSHHMTAYQAFTGAFAVKNLIPNVSGAVFRRPCLTEGERARLISYGFAGDWYFYALVARGGSIAFCKEAKAFFRYHPDSTSRRAFFTNKHLHEHRMILADLRELYDIGPDVVQAHVAELRRLFDQQGKGRLTDAQAHSLTPPPQKAKTLRICVASFGFQLGGGEAVPIDLANELRSRGHHVTFLSLTRPTAQSPEMQRRFLRQDIPVAYWDTVRGCFNAWMVDRGIDVFNSHNIAVDHSLYDQGLRVPMLYLATLHGGYETVPQLLTSSFMDFLARNVDEWLYLSEANREILVQHGLDGAAFTRSFNTPPRRGLYRGTAIDIRKALRLGGQAVLVVLASRALRAKGWGRAIAACAEARRRSDIDFRLILLGDGPDFAALRDESAGLRYVTFLGSVDDPGPIIAQCDLGVFPSTYAGESFPLFLLECCEHGLPVIAADTGRVAEVLRSGGGETPGRLLAPYQTDVAMVAEIAEAMIELCGDTAKLAAARGLARAVAQRYSHEDVVDLYLKIMAARLVPQASGFRDPNTL